MKVLILCAAILPLILAASCGSNSTAAGVSISPLTPNPVPVLENGSQQFSASVTGVSTTTVYWQVCLPAATITVQPTICTPVPGVTISGQSSLTGYGTITQNGLYTAPSSIPQPNNAVVMASSTVDTTAFAVHSVEVASTVQVQIYPTSVSMIGGEHYQFTATVTGTTNTSVQWSVNGNAGGDATDGYICPNPAAPQPCTAGEYFAPATGTSSATIKATSSQDTSVSASATATIAGSVDPTLSAIDPIDPATAAEGSVQQDVYVTGTNFFSTTTVQVGGVTLPLSDITFISSTLLRATIPGYLLQQEGLISLSAERQNGDLSVTSANLTVNPIRPAVVAATPDSVSQANTGAGFSLTGGYFVPGRTLAQFNGSSTGLTTSYLDSRHLTVTVPAGSFSVPGLYSLVVQNTDAATAGVPSLTAKNVAVTPAQSSILTAPIATVGVGASPSAVAIDAAAGLALVANTGENTVSVINLATNSANPNKIAVGTSPTGIAVDDLISPPLALVVNSADQTVSTINLATMSVVGTPLSVSLTTVAPVPLPFSVGIDPMTHHAIVAYQNTNEATILDLSSGAPVIVEQIGGNFSNYATGLSPAVAVDERLNWAVVTPGGSGIGVVNLVDLGRNPVPGVDAGRTPQLVATAQLSTTTLGVGLNQETHQLLFTDPVAGSLTSFNVFNATVNNITFTNSNGVAVNEAGMVAAAANPLTNLGIAVNSDSTALVVDLESGNVLQTVSGLGSTPAAVAIDPGTNEAVVANQGDGTVSILSLGSVRSPQILGSSPAATFTSSSPVTLTITGSGFEPGAAVRLDQVAVATSTVPSSCTTAPPILCRQLTATAPASMLGSARRFMLDILNADLTVSNITDFTVVQPVVVGTTPVAVAVDTDRDMAVVTNSVDGTVDLVALSPETPTMNGGTAGAVGLIGPPVSVGTNPQGVAVVPRLGLAVVANNGSNTASIVDETQTASPISLPLCNLMCTPVGVAANSDTGLAAVTAGQPAGTITNGVVNMININSASAGSLIQVDQGATGVGIDPTLDYAAVAASQTGAVDIVNLLTNSFAGPGRVSNFAEPTGVIFDPVNQVFLVTNSLLNSLVVVNPNTFETVSLSVGINPTSVDYDFQTSTVVTVNSTSNTMSVMDYDCPPYIGTVGCSIPRVRAVVGAGAPQLASSVVIGANAIAIDPKLDIAVEVDPNNNRILLVPLPH